MMKSVVAKPKQDEHKDLAGPTWESFLEHSDAALAVGTGGSDPVVDGQSCEKGHQNEDECGNRREYAGRQESDTRLVAERGEVVDPGKAHHPPPRVLAGVAAAMSALRTFEIGEQPICKGHWGVVSSITSDYGALT